MPMFYGDPHEVQQRDPAMTRELMRLIDETIAAESTCRFCGGAVKLQTTASPEPYVAWLVCENDGCQRKTKLA